MPTAPTKTLETFPNPQPDRDYIIEIETPEFTCLCPKTGQPDFATLLLEYVPDELCVELKSLKLYIWSYRDEGHFHEKVTNSILNDLVGALSPRYMRLRALFNVRGGVYTTVTAEYRKPGWRDLPPPPEDLPRTVQSAVAETDGSANEKARSSMSTAKSKHGRAATEAAAPPSTEPADPNTGTEVAAPPKPSASDPVAAPALRSERFRMLRRTRQPLADAPPAPSAPTPSKPSAPSAPAAPLRAPKPARDAYIGIDLGTTGCRAIVIDESGTELAQSEAPLPPPTRKGAEVTQEPADWWKAVNGVLAGVLREVAPTRIKRIAIAGTSATLLVCDAQGQPMSPGLMYNDARAQAEAERVAAVANAGCGAQGPSASLAKLLWFQGRKELAKAAHALHQTDWIAGRLSGRYGHSDYNNCLKLGFDVEALRWPDWLDRLEVARHWLPQVHAPGETIATIDAELGKTLGLPRETEIAAGTSDGVAAFLASGARLPGQGVTSLGTTLVLKLLSERPVFSASHGVYSHRLGRFFLAGGASNSGGAVLAQYFSPEQLAEMTPLLDPDHPTDLDYYPLPDIGERFPINDPKREPRLEPLPGDSVTFYQGILEGIARIEAQGYHLLAELGAPKVTGIWTTGGGARNPGWRRVRERALGVKLQKARSEHAAYGAALLAAGILQKTFQ